MGKVQDQAQADRKKIYIKQQCLKKKKIDKEGNIKTNDDITKLQK